VIGHPDSSFSFALYNKSKKRQPIYPKRLFFLIFGKINNGKGELSDALGIEAYVPIQSLAVCFKSLASNRN
jgi:hypothetical protein